MTREHAAATPARMPVVGRIGWLPGAIGAGLAILLAGLASRLAIGSDALVPLLVAPVGASALLVFVLPASPLSQPWPVFGSHVIAVAVSIAVHRLLPDPIVGSGLALGLAIALTSMARCLHPPSGGTAMLATLGSPANAALSWSFVVVPVALNAALLVGCGLLWHRFSGHSWPHHATPVPPVPSWPGHFEDEDLEAVLEEWDEVLDVSVEDLSAVLHSVERKVRERVLRG